MSNAAAFCSTHRLRTDGLGAGDRNTDPTVYVANLKTLSAMRTWDEDAKSLVDTTYRTPGFAPGGTTSATFDPTNVKREQVAMTKFRAAQSSGNLDVTHAAVDAVNEIRAGKGGIELHPLPEFHIVEHQDSALGDMARYISSERENCLETIDKEHPLGQGSMVGSPLPWFDTKESFDALAAYEG